MEELFPYRPMNLYQNYLEASQLYTDCAMVFDLPPCGISRARNGDDLR